MKKFLKRGVCLCMALLLALAAFPALSENAAIVIPHPARFVEKAGEMETFAAANGYVNYLIPCALNGETLSEDERAKIHDAFKEACEAAGYPCAGEDKDESGYVMRYYQAGEEMFALYVSGGSVQLMAPDSAKVEDYLYTPAKEPTAVFAEMILPDPTPLPTVAPRTENYLRGVLNGKAVEYRTRINVYSDQLYLVLYLFDDAQQLPIVSGHFTFGGSDLDSTIRLFETYTRTKSIDSLVRDPSIRKKGAEESEIYYRKDMAEGDFVSIMFTEWADDHTAFAGTLSFSLTDETGTKYVLENGTFHTTDMV